MLLRILIFIMMTISSVHAQDVESVYTSLHMKDDCDWGDFDGIGIADCAGLNADYPVIVAEGDLRMFVQFGETDDANIYLDGFMGFNYVNKVVEWRVEGGKPYATILRWFINYVDYEGNNIEGQTLVVSTVADPELPLVMRSSCHVAYIDALSNPDPNQLARQIAHLAAKTFRCGKDIPIYVGIRGELAGGAAQWHPAEVR